MKIDKIVASEYLYEYGLDKAAKLLKITPEKLEGIVNGEESQWQKPHINKNATIDYLNPKISEYIEKHYSELHSKYVKNKDKSIFYQDDEDVFHNSLIKLCSDLSNPSEQIIIKEFDRIFKTTKWENQKRNNQIRKKEKAMKEQYYNEEEQ